MNNKKVIRKDNKKGKFTTIHTSILHDTRLTSNAFRVLCSILNDHDDFNMSYKLIQGRFRLKRTAMRGAISNLEQCGYLRTKELPRGLYYTISEYGNLKTDDVIEDHSNEIQETLFEDINNPNCACYEAEVPPEADEQATQLKVLQIETKKRFLPPSKKVKDEQPQELPEAKQVVRQQEPQKINTPMDHGIVGPIPPKYRGKVPIFPPIPKDAKKKIYTYIDAIDPNMHLTIAEGKELREYVMKQLELKAIFDGVNVTEKLILDIHMIKKMGIAGRKRAASGNHYD